MIRRLRLASGLVMFAYVTTHFVNHSLGLVSVQVMDRALEHIYQYWACPLGGVLLYGAFATHYSLALWALWLRRSLKMPFAEATQLVLGILDSVFPHRSRPPDARRRHLLWRRCRLLLDGAAHVFRDQSAARRAPAHGAGDRLGPRHDRTVVLAAPEAVVPTLAADPLRLRAVDADLGDSRLFRGRPAGHGDGRGSGLGRRSSRRTIRAQHRRMPRSSIRWWCGCATPSWRRSLPCWPRGSRVGTGSAGAASSA